MGIKKGPNTTFPDNWKEIMINLGKQGKSNLQLFNMFDIGHSTHFKLLRNNPEYAYVYQLYLLEHETYWITLAKTSIENNSEFDNQLFFLTMGNKHRNKWNRKK